MKKFRMSAVILLALVSSQSVFASGGGGTGGAPFSGGGGTGGAPLAGGEHLAEVADAMIASVRLRNDGGTDARVRLGQRKDVTISLCVKSERDLNKWIYSGQHVRLGLSAQNFPEMCIKTIQPAVPTEARKVADVAVSSIAQHDRMMGGESEPAIVTFSSSLGPSTGLYLCQNDLNLDKTLSMAAATGRHAVLQLVHYSSFGDCVQSARLETPAVSQVSPRFGGNTGNISGATTSSAR